MNLAAEVLKGSTEKAKRGGTPYRAPLGYRNVREMVDGHEIRTIALDPDRAPLITRSLPALRHRRLRPQRPGRHPGGPRPAHAGDTQPAGQGGRGQAAVRHAAQPVLHRPGALPRQDLPGTPHAPDRRPRSSGSRPCCATSAPPASVPRAGSTICAAPSSAPTAASGSSTPAPAATAGPTSTSSAAAAAGECSQPHHRVEAVEAAIEQHYATVMLSEVRRERIAAAVREFCAVRQQASAPQLSAATTELAASSARNASCSTPTTRIASRRICSRKKSSASVVNGPRPSPPLPVCRPTASRSSPCSTKPWP